MTKETSDVPLPLFIACVLELGTLRCNNEDGNENVKKAIGFISKLTTLQVHHACLYISLPVFARLRLENAANFANSTPGGFAYI